MQLFRVYIPESQSVDHNEYINFNLDFIAIHVINCIHPFCTNKAIIEAIKTNGNIFYAIQIFIRLSKEISLTPKIHLILTQ